MERYVTAAPFLILSPLSFRRRTILTDIFSETKPNSCPKRIKDSRCDLFLILRMRIAEIGYAQRDQQQEHSEANADNIGQFERLAHAYKPL